MVDNMKILNLILALFLTGLWACGKPDPLPPAPPTEEEEVFELTWATRMDFEKEIVNLNNGVIYKDWYIYSGDLGFPPTLMAFNLATGDKGWEYVHDGILDSEIDYSYLVDNIYIGITGKGVIAIDVEQRHLLWEIDLHSKGFQIDRGSYGGNMKYFLTVDFGFGTPLQVQHLLEIDILTGEYSMALSLPPDSTGVKGISPPAFWNDPDSNRTLMVLNEYPNVQLPPEKDEQNIMAIDLETKEVVWKTENFTENFYSNSLHPPIIYKNTVITGGDWSIYAFDVRTGEQLWRMELPGYDYGGQFWTTTNHLLVGDKLFINPLSEEVLCLDPMTGNILWNNPKGGANCTDNMVYYAKEDLLVFTSWGYGSVMVLDALTGETLHEEHRYDDSSYNNDVVYDPVTDMFFTSTYKHAVGFRVHRP